MKLTLFATGACLRIAVGAASRPSEGTSALEEDLRALQRELAQSAPGGWSLSLSHAGQQVAFFGAGRFGGKGGKGGKGSGKSSKRGDKSGKGGGPGYGTRRLLLLEEEPVREDLPLEDARKIVRANEVYGAKPDASFEHDPGLISKGSCDALIRHADASREEDIAGGRALPVGKASDGMEDKEESWLDFEDKVNEQYNRRLTAEELLGLVGRDDALRIVDFFDGAFGGLPVDCMYLARHDNAEDGLVVPWHVDEYLTAVVDLNDDYEGGRVLHMNADGVHAAEVRPGSATAHKNDILHGVTASGGGAKYMLVLKHHPDRPDKKGVVRISRDIVDALSSDAEGVPSR